MDWGGGALWLLAPAMALSMGLSPLQVGMLFAARQIGSGIAHLPAGFIGDNLRKRGFFLLATFWCVAAAQLMASVSTDYWVLVGFLTLASAGAAAWHPVAMGIMTQWMPNRKGFVLGMHMAGGTIAEIAAPMLVGLSLMYLSWTQVLQINTIPTIILGLIFVRFAPMVIPPLAGLPIGPNIRSLARSVVQPGTLAILFTIVLHNMAMVAFMSMAPLFFQEVKDFSPGLTGLAFSVFLFGGAVASPFVGHISDVFGRKTMTIGGLVGGGICLWLITFGSSEWTIFPLLIITGILMLSVRSIVLAMALEKIGNRESTVLGLISAVGEGMAALGAVLAGVLGEIDLGLVLILAGGLSVVAGLAICPLTQNSSALSCKSMGSASG